jgi:hypothetical protein
MPPVGFELTIPASARPQTYALDCAVTGIGLLVIIRGYMLHWKQWIKAACSPYGGVHSTANAYMKSLMKQVKLQA